jgi:hypothetical protein
MLRRNLIGVAVCTLLLMTAQANADPTVFRHRAT